MESAKSTGAGALRYKAMTVRAVSLRPADGVQLRSWANRRLRPRLYERPLGIQWRRE